MKLTVNIKWLLALFFICVSSQTLLAQTKANIFDDQTPITWLGLDYSQTKFIGNAFNYKDKGHITNDAFRDLYIPQWNGLFIKEPKKYNVAEAVHRTSVKYAVDVTEKANAALKKDFFSDNKDDFKKITEADITAEVKNYDFQNNEGIGLMFFVEGMSKDKGMLGAWVTFVDMKSKTVLFTTYETGETGMAVGFRNYWIKPIYLILKDVGNNYKHWKK